MTWLTVQPKRTDRMNQRMFTHDFDRMHGIGSMHDIGSMFDSFFNFPTESCKRSEIFWPAVDVHETDEEIRLTLEAPGANKEDIKVTIKDRILTIEGKRELVSDETDGNLLVNEIRSGSFSRKFTLPKTVDTEKIKADFANGLLKISLAKLEEIKPKEIDISVK